jgi:hypothetical protein
MAVQIDKTSFLRFSPLLDVDGVLFFDTPNLPTILPSNGDIVHEVADTEVNRLDLISFKYYRDPGLWWVILLANGKYNLNEFYVGEKITVPDPAYVFSEILSTRK